MTAAFMLRFCPGGPGAVGPRNATKGAETGAWRQAPCLLPARFGFLVLHLAFSSLSTSLPPPHQPDLRALAPATLALVQTGWPRWGEPSRSHSPSRPWALSFQEAFR